MGDEGEIWQAQKEHWREQKENWRQDFNERVLPEIKRLCSEYKMFYSAVGPYLHKVKKAGITIDIYDTGKFKVSTQKRFNAGMDKIIFEVKRLATL
jgi:hypothetical protein